MAYDWIDAHLLAKPGVEKNYQEEWQAWRYLLGGKMFTMQGGDKTGRPILTMKLPPAESLILRENHPALIVPGYYMNSSTGAPSTWTGTCRRSFCALPRTPPTAACWTRCPKSCGRN